MSRKKRNGRSRGKQPKKVFPTVTGRVQMTREGFAFIIVEDGDDTSLSVTGLPIDGNVGSICVTSLDKYTKDIEVGFIKLDIEGNEVNAIKGARETIVRDKPFLAICVYHKKGDILAIMDLIHNLEPSYRFWLRDYSITGKETVLYAAVVS